MGFARNTGSVSFQILTKYLKVNLAPTERGMNFTVSLNRSEMKLQTYKPASIRVFIFLCLGILWTKGHFKSKPNHNILAILNPLTLTRAEQRCHSVTQDVDNGVT